MSEQKIKMEVPYFQVPNAIFDREDLELSSIEKLVYIYLCRCGNHGGKAFPSYQTISNRTGMSKSSVIRAIDNLIDKKFISKKARKSSDKNRLSNIYFVDLLSHRQYPIVTQTPYKKPVKKKYKQKKSKRSELTNADMEVLLKIGAIK
jgi:predicted transcriptional regulator